MKQPDRALEIGAIMQLNPDPDVTRNAMFCACLFVVTEPKPWGAQGYVQGLGANGEPGGQAYYRANWEEMAPTGGVAEWMPDGEPARARTQTVLVDDLRRLQPQIERNTTLIQEIRKENKHD